MRTANQAIVADPTAELAAFGAQLTHAQLPPEVVERIKVSVLDSLGCCIFGATLPWTQKVAQLAFTERARPIASVIGSGRMTSIPLAVLVNGTAGHAFELDDIHRESILHIGSLATPVALAFAEAGNLSGRDVITAMAAGYEVGARVGNAATTALFFRGFHPQGTSGVFAAASTAAHMLRLDAGRFQHALGIAGSQAGGLMAAQEGAMVKRLHSGRAAQSGAYAALLAEADFTGIPDVLEASYGGYLSSYSDQPNLTRLTHGLGSVWETLQVGYKPHASVTSIHAALDGLAAILRDEQLSADELQRVDVGVSRMTHVHCAWEYAPTGVTSAQMNLFYGLAVMALDGRAFTEQYGESRLSDPLILNLIKKMHAHVDDEIEAMGPSARHASRVRVQTTDGRVFERLVMDRHGSPEDPMTPGEIEYKFRAVVGPYVGKKSMNRIIDLVSRLDQIDDIRELQALIRPKARVRRQMAAVTE